MSRPSAQRLMAQHLDSLHRKIEERLHPSGSGPWEHERVEVTIDAMWTLAQSAALSPHLCRDRYCLCHVLLHEGEPQPLFGDPNGW